MTNDIDLVIDMKSDDVETLDEIDSKRLEAQISARALDKEWKAAKEFKI